MALTIKVYLVIQSIHDAEQDEPNRVVHSAYLTRSAAEAQAALLLDAEIVKCHARKKGVANENPTYNSG